MRDKSELEALKKQPIVLAVSGGSDSMALLHECIETGFEELNIVTIDHGLRAAAAKEAEFVKSVCVARDIPHTTIKVHVEKVGNLQSNARDARYEALIAHCQHINAAHIFLGHTADDQAETFLLRAFRGSGVDGLAAIAMKREQEGVTFWRPLLERRRHELRAMLLQNGWTWIDDPSNDDHSFDRVKMRGLIGQAEDAGFSIDGLIQSASNMARAKDALDPLVKNFMDDHVVSLPLDVEDHIDPVAFAALPMSVATKVLGAMCQKFGGSDYLPRRDGIDRLYDQILTLNEGGMVIGLTDFHWSQNRIRVCAEYAGLPEITSGSVWHRWQKFDNNPFEIRPLGEEVHQFSHWREHGIAQRAARTLPAYFDGNELVHVHGQNTDNFAFTLIKK